MSASDSYALQPANAVTNSLLPPMPSDGWGAGIVPDVKMPPGDFTGHPAVNNGIMDMSFKPRIEPNSQPVIRPGDIQIPAPGPATGSAPDIGGPVVPPSMVGEEGSPSGPDYLRNGSAPQPTQATPGINPVTQQLLQAQQQYANYQTPMQAHPFFGALASFYLPQAGMVMNAIGNAGLNAQQRKIQALQQAYQMQQAGDQAQFNRGVYNGIAPTMGLPQATGLANPDDKTLGVISTLVQKYGAPKLIQAQQQYNIDAANYERAQQTLATYNAKSKAGLLSDAEKKAGAPVVPAAPQLKIDGVNPFLDAGTAAGMTGTAGEAMKTGEESGAAAATNATTEKDTQARIAEMHEASQERHEDRQDSLSERSDYHKGLIGINQQRTDQQGQHYDELNTHYGNMDSTAKARLSSGNGQLLARGAQLASNDAAQTANQLKAVDGRIQSLANDHIKKGTDMTRDPMYGYLKAQHDQLSAVFQQKQARAGQASQRFNDFVNNGVDPTTAPGQAMPSQAAPVSAGGVHALSDAPKTVKVPALFKKYAGIH